MSHLKTDWLCIATEGDTVDGRQIYREWIIDMGKPITRISTAQ
jgi:hypothetical protein